MAALTAPRDTQEKAHSYMMADQRGVATGVTIYAGAIVVRNAAGYLAPATTATTIAPMGVAQETVTNAGANGAVTCKFRQGLFRFNNSSAGDLLAISDIGADSYLVDDNTVAKTSATNTRTRAGKVFDVDSLGVWVLIGTGV